MAQMLSFKNYLVNWSDMTSIDVIITTGGTGLSSRDVTPKATREVIERSCEGISIALITQSVQMVKMAMLSR